MVMVSFSNIRLPGKGKLYKRKGNKVHHKRFRVYIVQRGNVFYLFAKVLCDCAMINFKSVNSRFSMMNGCIYGMS